MQKQRHLIYKFIKINICILFAVVFAHLPIDANSQVFDETEDYYDADQLTTSSNETLKQTSEYKNVLPLKRGTSQRFVKKNKSIGAVNKKVDVKKVQEVDPESSAGTNTDPNEKIYMYMRDFKISRDLTGMVSCSMRFYIYSKVKEKINNVSYRLKWPKIETPLSFSGIETDKPLYKNYTLLGDGCYDLDIAPNIIVNRCRIKGRTQQYCSSIIQWSK